MRDSNNNYAPRGIYGYAVSIFIGFAVGYVLGIVALLRLPWADGRPPNLLQITIVIASAVVALLIRQLSLHAGASMTFGRRLVSSLAAAVAWVAVAFSVAPAPSLTVWLLTVAVVCAAWSAVVNSLSLGLYWLLAILASCYAWVGPHVSDVPIVPMIAIAGVAASGVAIVVVGVLVRNHGAAIAQTGAVLAIFGVAAIACTALISFPRAYLSGEWEIHPVKTTPTRLLTGLPAAEPLLFSAYVTASSDSNGNLAVLDRAGSGRYVLWRRSSEGGWSRTIMAAGFARPDGRRLFLHDNKSAAKAETSLWQQISRTTSAVPFVGDIQSIALHNKRVYAVADTGLWDISEPVATLIGDPWTRPAQSRVMAVNSKGEAAVLSNYLTNGRRDSKLESISLSDAAIRVVSVTPSGDVFDDQWPLVGLSRLPDDSFASLSGTQLIGITAAGSTRRIGMLTFDRRFAWDTFVMTDSVFFSSEAGGATGAGQYSYTNGQFKATGLGDRLTLNLDPPIGNVWRSAR